MKVDSANQARLEALQWEEYSILEAFDAFCQQQGFRYYLAYGTLLGCIRHHGFIPWDDDLDVFMPREDYEKLAACSSWEDLAFSVRTYRNTAEEDPSISYQIKVESKTRAIARKVGEQTVLQHIWIDVFALDGMPGTALGRSIHYGCFQLRHSMFRAARSARNGRLKEKKRGTLERLGIWFFEIVPLGKMMSIRRRMQKTDDLLMQVPFDCSDVVFGYAPEYGKKRILKRKWFSGERKEWFCGKEYPVPSGSEEMLTQWYGDYLQLPPEGERFAKHCEEIVETP